MRRVTVPAPFASFPRDRHLSPDIDTGEWVFFSGDTGTRPNGGVADDPETQFRDAFGFVTAYLREAELDWEDVVEMTTYHVELRRHLDAFVRVKDEFVHEPYPAWFAVGVSEPITPGMLLEFRCSGGSPPAASQELARQPEVGAEVMIGARKPPNENALASRRQLRVRAGRSTSAMTSASALGGGRDLHDPEGAATA